MSANRAFLAFDFGERRIGVAIGNDLTETANPLTAIDAESDDARFTRSRRWSMNGGRTRLSSDGHRTRRQAARDDRALREICATTARSL